MAVVVSYDGSVVEVTGGTSGVPATFVDIYAADLAGSFTLLDAAVVSSEMRPRRERI